MESDRFKAGRHAGLLLPLFSAASRSGWGVGEIADFPLLACWMQRAGLDFLLTLPLNEMNSSQHSPYSAVSAMAIDPIYVTLREVPDFIGLGGEAALPPAARLALDAARNSERIDYVVVRALKMAALRQSFDRFEAIEWRAGTERARALEHYMQREGWWLDDYTLYRVLRDRHEARPWWEWSEAFARREPAALRILREEASRDCLFFAYIQWIAEEQWQAARAAAAPVGVFGDMPFMVSSDSADAWAEQHAFRFDATVGAPPDAFSETGQDWGLPVYRWDVFARENDAWLRARAKRTASLFDGFRVDHVVGFYRTYVISATNGHREFVPPAEHDQLAQGERVLRALLDSGAGVLAEDLGTIPTFVRDSLARLRVPGYKVLRWERDWDNHGQPFRDPQQYPAVSLSTTGTHDTETLVEWWESASRDERLKVLDIPLLRQRRLNADEPSLAPSTRDALLELLWASNAALVVVPLQDVFGWRDRINIPATVTDANWTWRVPGFVEALNQEPDARARADTLVGWAKEHHRSHGLTVRSPTS